MSTDASLTVGDEDKYIELPVTDEDGSTVELAGSTTLNLWLESPGGTATSYTATPKVGTTTTAQYQLDGTEFIESGTDAPGWWLAQIEYELANGEGGHSWPLKKFYVGRRLG